MITALLILTVISTVLLWGLLIAFGVWTHRRFKLKSLTWLILYLVLPLVVTPLTASVAQSATEAIVASTKGVYPLGMSLGTLTATLAYWKTFTVTLAKVVLSILILSDIASVLSRAGIEVEGRFLNRLLRARAKSTSLGIAMIVLMLSGLAIWLPLYLYYV